MYSVYLLECGDGSLYTGITTDLQRRFREHRSGNASHYTSAKKALAIHEIEKVPDRSRALKREAAIKRLNRSDKIKLIVRDMKVSDAAPMFFVSGTEFRAWLRAYGKQQDELWLGFYKKGASVKGISYAQALDEALCFGWIDGLKKTWNEDSYRLRFTPRRAASVWSLVNREHAERLIKAKRMTAAGLKEIKRAQADGRWDSAYAPASRSEVPQDLAQALKKHAPSARFFESLSAANRYAITYRLQTAKKPETRARRLQLILGMLRDKKTFH